MVRFQSGLRYVIRDMLELLSYNDLNDLVQMYIRVEQQLKRKISSKKDYPIMSSTQKEYKREGYPSKSKRPLEKEKKYIKRRKKEILEKIIPKTLDIRMFSVLGV